ncbi:MAG: nicotinate-nucleotide adenylyltransferase [Firmicutes bacterium]|jgi:nicotinate-nucleotide adenylyltransferase|nr:nicotinate-nucleotide adenylyltransferase [Bacillota bacterium]
MSRQTKPLKVAVMGGTFDPVHYGHLVTAEAVRGEFGINHVLFVPSGRPPHKKLQQVSDAEHRYLMTVFATLTNPYFEVSRVDIDREGKSYTIDTLRALRQQYGDDTELYFITGADAIAEIMSWKSAEELLCLSEFVAATRPGYQLDARLEQWFAEHGKKLHTLQVPAMAISSTDIRNRVKAGKSIRYLVPEAVEHYIHKNRLYLDA